MRLTFPIKVIRIDRTINNDHFFVMLDTLSSLVLLSIHVIILFRIYIFIHAWRLLVSKEIRHTSLA